jgi:hypothetical protein
MLADSQLSFTSFRFPQLCFLVWANVILRVSLGIKNVALTNKIWFSTECGAELAIHVRFLNRERPSRNIKGKVFQTLAVSLLFPTQKWYKLL